MLKNLALLLLLSIAGTANATQTLAPMRLCQNCTLTGMQNLAKTGSLGISYVYDLQNNVIHKFNTYNDTSCRPGTPNPIIRSGGGNTDTCTPFRAADLQDPVDTSVFSVFQALRNVNLVNPVLANTGKAERRADPFTDPITHQPYNMPRVAWDYPQGSYVRFMDGLRDILGNKASANAWAPGLGDYIFDFSWSSHGVSIQIAGLPNITVDLSWDRTTGTLHLSVCNPNGDCAKVDVKIDKSEIGDMTYTGVFDAEQQMYPSASGTAPGHLHQFGWDLGPVADHFGQGLQGDGVYVGTRPGCPIGTHTGLGFTRDPNGNVSSTTWFCIPN